MTAYIVYAMPGTVIDISDNIVRKDMSFIEPQRKFIEEELLRKICVRKLESIIFNHIAWCSVIIFFLKPS
jgi:hypothetical protein